MIAVNRRRYMWGGGGSDIPYKVTEYIGATGTQRINLGISGSATFEVVAQATSSATSSMLLLSSDGNGSAGTWFGSANGKWGSGTNAGAFVNISSQTKEVINIDFGPSAINGTIDGNTFTRTSGNYGTWYLFSASGGAYPFTGKVFSIKAYQNGVLVRDMLPVVIGFDAYLYDKVTEQVFGNNGTGQFEFDYNDVTYIPIEYIQCTGTQRIETGLSGNTAFDVVAQATSSSTSSLVLLGGNGNASGGTWFGSSNGKWGFGSGSGAYVNISSQTKESISLDFSANLASGIIEGNSFSRTHSTSYTGWTLFSVPGGNYLFQGKLFSIKAYQGGVMVMDAIPMRVETEGLLYDRVQQKNMRAIGTGSFILGPDINT